MSASEFAGALTAGLDNPFLGPAAQIRPLAAAQAAYWRLVRSRAAVRVGLDLLFLVPGQTGGRETYARELVRGLAAERPDLELTALVNRETAAAGAGFWSEAAHVIEVGSSGVARGSWALGELWRLPRAARGLDVLHSPANFAPLHGGPRARAQRPRRAVAQAARDRADRDAARHERARHRRPPGARDRVITGLARRARPTSSSELRDAAERSRSCPTA